MSTEIRTIPAITPTTEQWAVIDSLHDPYVKQDNESADLHVYEIKDDNHVALYTISSDGTYFVETLLDGFNYGWTRLDSDSYVVDSEGTRQHVEPHPDWS